MKLLNSKCAVAAALISLASISTVSPALAAIQDYEFQLIKSEIKKGETVIAVRVINKVIGKPVPDAVIFATRLDMAPDGMQEMATKVTPSQAPNQASISSSAMVGRRATGFIASTRFAMSTALSTD